MLKAKLFLILLLLQTSGEVIGHYCSCNEIRSSCDCQSNSHFYCNWTNRTCQNYYSSSTNTTTPCSAYDDSTNCNNDKNCGWTDYQCTNFTECSDYQYFSGSNQQCYEIGTGCINGENSWCIEGQLDCSQIEYRSLCEAGLKVDHNVTCVWETSKCQMLDYSKCSNIQFQSSCLEYNCVWENYECRAPYCAYYTQKSNCYNRRANDLMGSIILCDWVNNTCTDMNTTLLTAENCHKNTNYTYYWSGTSCNACVGEYSTIMVFLGAMIAIMM